MSKGDQKGVPQKIYERIAEFAETGRDHPAIIAGDEVVSYRTLLRTATGLSHKLRQHVPAGCLIGLYQELGIAYLRSLLAVLLAECAYVPLDSRAAPEYIARLGLETGTTALLTSEAKLPELSVLPRAASIKLTRSQHLLSFSPHGNCQVSRKSRGFREPVVLRGSERVELANVIFTSGSGGRPKAIARTHAAIVEHAEAWAAILAREERCRFLLASSPAFSMSMTAIFLTWLTGETLVLPIQGWSQNPRLLADCIIERRVTGMKIIPSLLPRLASALEIASKDSLPQVVIVSGEKATWNHINVWRNIAPRCRVFNTYGLTEAFSVTAYEVPHGSSRPSGDLPIGKPVPGNSFMVLDGRLHVRGSCLAAGIVVRGRLEPLPTVRQNDEIWFLTADRGSLDPSGVFHFSGRVDCNIKSRGYLIDPVAIEQTLTEEPGIAEAGVTKHLSSDQLVALLVLDDRDLDIRCLRVSLSNRLRSFEVPQVFRAVDTLPKLLSGKIDRASCDPESGRQLLPLGPFGRPALTDVECRISEIVQERLGAVSLGVDQTWYELGGDSLGLQDLVLTLENEFGAFFNDDLSPFTIRRLAEVVEKASSATTRYRVRRSAISYAGPVTVRAAKELLDPLEHWERLHVSDFSTEPYTVSQRIRLQRPEKLPFDQTSLRLEFLEGAVLDRVGAAIAELVTAHDGLRRLLSPETKEQVMLSVAGHVLLPLFDARNLSRRQKESVVRQFFAMPLDPATWPAMRWIIVRERHQDLLLWQLSHTLVDLVSTDVLARQFLEIYSNLDKGIQNQHAAQNRSSDWHTQMETLRYSHEVISWTRDMVTRYCQLAIYCKTELTKLRVNAGARTHRYTRLGNYQEILIEDAFDHRTAVASILAPYIAAVARWLGVSGIPLRVGSAAREYSAFDGSFRDTVGQFNDHFLLPIDTPWNASVVEVEDQLSEQFRFIREHSINFDKIIEILRSEGDPHCAALPTLVAAAPLGDLTARESHDGKVRTVPRPRWGRWSFNPGAGGTKIGLYTFRNGDSTDLLLYSKGIWSRAFELLVDELQELLPARVPSRQVGCA